MVQPITGWFQVLIWTPPPEYRPCSTSHELHLSKVVSCARSSATKTASKLARGLALAFSLPYPSVTFSRMSHSRCKASHELTRCHALRRHSKIERPRRPQALRCPGPTQSVTYRRLFAFSIHRDAPIAADHLGESPSFARRRLFQSSLSSAISGIATVIT
jgi:hypothetical protein